MPSAVPPNDVDGGDVNDGADVVCGMFETGCWIDVVIGAAIVAAFVGPVAADDNAGQSVYKSTCALPPCSPAHSSSNCQQQLKAQPLFNLNASQPLQTSQHTTRRLHPSQKNQITDLFRLQRSPILDSVGMPLNVNHEPR